MKRIAVIFALFAAGSIAWGQAPTQNRPQPPRFAPAVHSPEVDSTGRVTFRYRAPNAKEVVVLRDGGSPLPMKMDDQGVWSATTEPLAPDFYPYSFLVDGSAMPDPSNSFLKPMYKMALGQSVVHVPGPASQAGNGMMSHTERSRTTSINPPSLATTGTSTCTLRRITILIASSPTRSSTCFTDSATMPAPGRQ